jgi:hypothetical protein
VEISRGCLNERLESNPNQPLIFSPADSVSRVRRHAHRRALRGSQNNAQTATCVKLFVNERDMSPCPNGGGEV